MIKKHIPNFITSMNIACGVLGVMFCFEGRIDIAFPLMLLAAVFDFCDGLAARLLHAYSPMGKELDSLCDCVSFGVLPASMLYCTMKAITFPAGWFCYVPLVIAVFSALRLAKFNIDEEQQHGFLGLATPVCAILCGSLSYFIAHEPTSWIALACSYPLVLPVISIVLCALLVSRIPMFSMKFSKDDDKSLKLKRITFLVECVILIAMVLILGYNWSLALTLCCILYILKNVVYSLEMA